MGKKKRTNKEKNIIPTRSKKERQEEVRKIILSLTTYQLTTEYAEVQELFKLLQIYINTGERQEINIPFPEINKRIKGILASSKRENVSVWLTGI